MSVQSLPRIIILSFLMLVLPLNGIASKKDKLEDSKLADELKAKYKKFDVAIKSSKNTYEFNYDEKTKKLYVLESIEYEYIALVPNVSHNCIIPYNESSNVDKVRFSNGSKKFVKTTPVYSSYEQEGTFHSDDKICIVKITFPSKGALGKIIAQKKYDDIKFFNRCFFQSALPTVKREMIFKIPSWLSLNLMPYNFNNLDIQKEETKETDGTRIITFLAKNIDNVPDEINSDGPSYYVPHLMIIPEKADVSLSDPLITSTLDLYKWYEGLIDELKPQKELLREKVDEIIADSDSDLNKISKIFSWVQDNIRYIAYEQGIMGFKPYEAHEVLNKKYGDCKGMANLMVEMLKIAGFDARMTWLGTNYLCYDYSIPSLAVDNHCITTLFYGGETYFLDATEKFMPLGSVAERIQGRQVMINNGPDYILKKIPQGSSIDNKRVQTAQFKVDGDQLSGTTKITYFGETRSNLFNVFSSSQTDLHQKLLEELFHRTDNNVVVNKSDNSDLFDVSKPFEVNADIVVNNKLSTFEDDTYLIFDWDKALKTAQTKSDRKTDLYFGRKFYIEKHIDFIVPSDLKVIHLPQDLNIETPEYSFRGKIVNNGDKLSYSLTIDLKTARIKMSQFQVWNDAIRQLSTFYDDQIVLTRK